MVATVTNASVALGGAVTVAAITAPSRGLGRPDRSLCPRRGQTLGQPRRVAALNTAAAPATLTVGTSTVGLPAGPTCAHPSPARRLHPGAVAPADVTLGGRRPPTAASPPGRARQRGLLPGAGTGSRTASGRPRQALLVVTASGLAGQVSGDVTTTWGPPSRSRARWAHVNNTAAAVSTSLTVGGVTETLTVAAGPNLRFEGTGLTLTVLVRPSP